MITIGIDPGIERTGVGIVEEEKGKLKLLYSKLIKTESKLPQSVRLLQLYTELTEIISMYKIDHASVEKLFFIKNVKTAMAVSEARGVILLTLQNKNISIFEYTPLQIKQALVGYGRGTKDQVQYLVKIILSLDEKAIQDDVADGIACAITHINSYKLISKIKK